MIEYKATSFIPMVQEPKRITTSDKVADLVRGMLLEKIKEKEFLVLITLDGASRVIRAEVIHIGSLNQSMIHPREVFRPAIADGSAGIIICHNHPSGTLEASRADIQITDRLKEASKIIGIELLDHIIVTQDGHYSFSDQGLL